MLTGAVLRQPAPVSIITSSAEKCTCALHLRTKKSWHPWKNGSTSPARSSHEACDSHCTDLLWSRVRFSESKQVRGCPCCQTFEGDTVRSGSESPLEPSAPGASCQAYRNEQSRKRT